MNTFAKSLAIALSVGILTAASSFSEARPIGRPTAVASYKSGLYVSAGSKLNIALDKQTGGTVDVRLKNAEGSVVFSQRVGKNESAYRTRLNLSELPDGVYQVEITNGVETTTHTITLATEQPQVPYRQIILK